MANSVDPDQTAPIGAVCSGVTCMLFICFLYFVYLVSADPDIGDIDGK